MQESARGKRLVELVRTGRRPPRSGRRSWAFRFFALTAPGYAAVACSDDVLTSPRPSQTIVASGTDTVLIVRAFDPSERPFAEIAQAVPSFGGFFVEGDVLVGYVKDPSDADAAHSALEGLRIAAGDESALSLNVVIRQGRYSFQELAAFRSFARDHILGMDGVTALDLDERMNRVEIGLSRDKVQEVKQAVLARLAQLDVTPEAFAFTERSPVRLAADSLRAHVRPLRGGLQSFQVDQFGIAIPDSICTLGFNAKLNGQNVVFTASHCTDELMDYDAGGVYQNVQNASKFVGYEYSDPDVESCGTWPFGYDCRDSDAAAFKYQGGVSFDWGYIVKPTGTPSQTWGSSGSLEIGSTDFEIVAVGNANSWNEVDKVGRTTGWTRGDIVDTCEDLPGTDGVRRMCSMVADFYSWGGDSGAPVFVVTSGSNVKLVGMYWGYTDDSLSVFSSWNGLVDDFGSFSVFNPPLEVDIDGPSAVQPETECVWEAEIVSGGTPPYTYTWSGVLSGSGSSVSGEVSSSGNLSLVVEDDEGETDGVLLYVTVTGGAPECEA